MKKYLFIALLVFISSCSSDDNKAKDEDESGVVGKWKLIEQLADPGDGSGTFQSIESERIITFFKNGIVEINGVLCFMTSETGDKETGSYSLTSDNAADTTYDGEIFPNTCSSSFSKVFFDLPTSGNLILWYTCIEGCGQKFEKI